MATGTVTRSPLVTSGVPGATSASPVGGTGTATTPSTTGNAAVGTGYSSNAVGGTGASTNIRAAAANATNPALVVNNSGGTLTVGGQAVTNAETGIQAVNNVSNFINGPTPQNASTNVGVGNAISALTAFAQGKMDTVKANIQALMNSEGGEMNAAKLQAYTQELSTYETMMQMAAKLQEQEDRAIQVWTRI